MARKGNPISVRRDLNRSSNSSRFSGFTSTTRKKLLVQFARFIIVALIIIMLLTLGEEDWVKTFFLKGILSRSLSLLLVKVGCSSSIIFIFILIMKSLLTAELSANMVLPAGVEADIDTSGHSNSSARRWKSFEERVLMEPFPTEESGSGTGERSINQGLPANAGASGGEEAGPSNQVAYPYQENEIIGGDSVGSIKRRLLFKLDSPSPEEILWEHYNAQDLFEIKVPIIHSMAGLDPTGDWLGRGARALDNAYTASGEPHLEDLYKILDDLNAHGRESNAFAILKEKVRLRPPGGWESDADSNA